MDFAGPFQNKMFLIVVDAHSKWPEVMQMTSTSAEQTIVVLRQLFASYGLPLQLVSDNGPQFTAIEFQRFLSKAHQMLTLPSFFQWVGGTIC